MHSKVSSHFPFLVTHVFRICNAVCFLRHLFVEYIHSNSTTTATHTLLLLFLGNGELLLLIVALVSLLLSIVTAWSFSFRSFVVDVVPCHPVGWMTPTKGKENRIAVLVNCHGLIVLFSFFCSWRRALPSSGLNDAYERKREQDRCSCQLSRPDSSLFVLL